MHGDSQIWRLQSMCLCLKCKHSKYFKNLITGTYFNLKKYIIPLEFTSVWPIFCIQKHINFEIFVISRQCLKQCISKTSMETPYFYVLFVFCSIRWCCMQGIIKMNYAHTSLNLYMNIYIYIMFDYFDFKGLLSGLGIIN